MNNPFLKLNLRYLLILTAFAGAALRIVVFFQNRSLFLDEANLARNIAERRGWDFFEPLSYQQFAPPLFSWLVKASTLLLGNTEFGLRLVPLLAGLASLYLFYRIATDLIPSFPAQWMAVWIFSFHGQLLRYATECKQYGADVFAALLFICLALAQSRRPFGWKQAFGWALFGAAMIWFSMPLVFVLSGVGIYLLFHFWKRKDRKAFWGMGMAIAAWLLSFGLFFLLLLRPDAEGDYLQQYHQPYFLPLLPGSAAEWSQLGKLLLGLVGDFAGPTLVAQAVGIIGLLVACLPERLRRQGLLGACLPERRKENSLGTASFNLPPCFRFELLFAPQPTRAVFGSPTLARQRIRVGHHLGKSGPVRQAGRIAAAGFDGRSSHLFPLFC
ncbi:MAG: glycosyltransferase family 39 protein [Saprospirales bacterium]|nr:glycosyltransferase family 39 protein [Saprospirales bacterium]